MRYAIHHAIFLRCIGCDWHRKILKKPLTPCHPSLSMNRFAKFTDGASQRSARLNVGSLVTIVLFNLWPNINRKLFELQIGSKHDEKI